MSTTTYFHLDFALFARHRPPILAAFLARVRGLALDRALAAGADPASSRALVEIETLRERAELIVLPPPCPLAVAPIDFTHADELIRVAYADGCEYLDAVEAGDAEVPLAMTMPHHRELIASSA